MRGTGFGLDSGAEGMTLTGSRTPTFEMLAPRERRCGRRILTRVRTVSIIETRRTAGVEYRISFRPESPPVDSTAGGLSFGLIDVPRCDQPHRTIRFRLNRAEPPFLGNALCATARRRLAASSGAGRVLHPTRPEGEKHDENSQRRHLSLHVVRQCRPPGTRPRNAALLRVFHDESRLGDRGRFPIRTAGNTRNAEKESAPKRTAPLAGRPLLGNRHARREPRWTRLPIQSAPRFWANSHSNNFGSR
jgi:hypothetical protein